MKNLEKSYFALIEGDKVTRKVKKRILGKRLSNGRLRKLLKSVVLGDPIKTMYERRVIKPYAFCPKCGCTEWYSTGNMTEYPEHWEKFICLRCKSTIGYIDNSPFIHALECPDNNYDPTF